MRAAVYNGIPTAEGNHLRIEDVPRPMLQSGHVLLRVIACGVCRTDLHIVEGDLPSLRPNLIPGHQIVGEVVDGGTDAIPLGSQVGVSWMGGTDGDCWFCKHQMENLCDHPVFTGYTVDGGYAEYALVRADFTFPIPLGLDAVHVAPLLCAGIIGFSCAQESSASGACVLPEYNRANVWACSVLGVPPHLRCPFCSPGDARPTSSHGVRHTERPPQSSMQPGSGERMTVPRLH